MDRAQRLAKLAALNAAQTFEEEQTALEDAPGVDLLADLPQDRGNLWRLHIHDMKPEDREGLVAIAKDLALPWERGARAYYVGSAQIDALTAALEEEGFIVARGL